MNDYYFGEPLDFDPIHRGTETTGSIPSPKFNEGDRVRFRGQYYRIGRSIRWHEKPPHWSYVLLNGYGDIKIVDEQFLGK